MLSGSDITTIQCSCSHLCIPLLLQFFLDDFEFKKPNQALLNMEKGKLMPRIITIKKLQSYSVLLNAILRDYTNFDQKNVLGCIIMRRHICQLVMRLYCYPCRIGICIMDMSYDRIHIV